MLYFTAVLDGQVNISSDRSIIASAIDSGYRNRSIDGDGCPCGNVFIKATTYNITTGCLLLALSIGILFCIRIVEYLNLLPYHQRISVGYNNIIANVWTG